MATKSNKTINVAFVGLGADENPPATALYRYAPKKRAFEKVARVDGGRLPVDPDELKGVDVAVGPDVDDPKTLDPTTLIRFRGDQVIDDWRARGLLIPADRWKLFLREIICVSGRVRKCRPWWWDLVVADRITLAQPFASGVKLGVQRRALPTPALDLSSLAIKLPFRCLPLCDGRVEIFERVCCCTRIIWDDLHDRLRDVLDDLPVEVVFPDPPIPDPGPLARLSRVARRAAPALRNVARAAAPITAADLARTTVSERVFEDYQALLRTPRDQVDAFVAARPYLSAYICTCTTRRVGEVAIRPSGEFDFCYWRPLRLHPHFHRCYTTYAYRVRQLISGVWTIVYNGVAAQEYFGQGEEAVLTTSHPLARPCGDGPPPPDPGDGTPFVMLEYVTSPGTEHFNFPAQTALTRVGAVTGDDGLIDFGGAPDCPWAKTLGLRLWVDPSLEGTVVFYRLWVTAVNAAGQATGAPTILTDPVSWRRFVDVPGDTIVTSTGLATNPADVGGQEGLFTVPYWQSPDRRWLSGQYHQVWDTTDHPDGKYMLILELFGPGGARIKPNGAPAGDPGTARPFQFRRWEAPNDTANVPFGDCAHVLWLNNTPVVGDIVDLRRNGVASTDECQFMSGPGATTFSTGFRAYHVNGVTTGGGPGDTNSFMRAYSITWQRGLNGPTGTLETGTADQGELAVEASNTETFATLLGAFPPTHPAHTRCTFSVHLHVDAKHHNGGGFINEYDYRETASFALEITS